MTEAKDICRQFAMFELSGTIPNLIRGSDVSNRETSDAPLWLFTAVADYIKAAGGNYILDEDCGGRTLRQILISIGEHYRDGTPNGIIMDQDTGLIFSPSHFTWMDTNYPAGTPREGYPVEIQALWLAALQLLAGIDEDGGWDALREKVRKNFLELFYLKEERYLSDCLHARKGTAANKAAADDACRSNQLLAITLGLVTDRKIQLEILNACEQLLIPGAIRSLADQPVKYPQPVICHNKLLNDPLRPYWGTYKGDDDTRRKPAYHNGTAWTWPFPSYCEALYMIGGEESRSRAAALLLSASEIINSGVPCHTPEVLDGNFPHLWRGCGAQAWGITELFRVYKILAFK
jgi:predicted glycogen debranching enzyme